MCQSYPTDAGRFKASNGLFVSVTTIAWFLAWKPTKKINQFCWKRATDYGISLFFAAAFGYKQWEAKGYEMGEVSQNSKIQLWPNSNAICYRLEKHIRGRGDKRGVDFSEPARARQTFLHIACVFSSGSQPTKAHFDFSWEKTSNIIPMYRTYSVIGIHSDRHNGATFWKCLEGGAL